MSRKIVNTNIRLNLENEDDRRAWKYLQGMDRTRFKSYSRAVVAALNDFFDRQERLANDPYLETREKEDAFLKRVLDTVERGLRSMILPDSPSRNLTAEPSESSMSSAISMDGDAERSAAEDTLMDFIDSF